MHDDAVRMTVAVVSAAVCVVLFAALVAAIMRRPHTWLAALGPAMLLCGVLCSLFLSDMNTLEGALNVAGFALTFTSYPDGRVGPRALLALVLALGWAAALLSLGEAALHPWAQTASLSVVLLTMIVLVQRYRRRLNTQEREQVRWALLGAFITLSGTITLGVVTVVIPARTSVDELGPFAGALMTALIMAFPITLVIGMVRPSLASVDIALFHTLRAILCAAPLTIASAALLKFLPAPTGAWCALLLVAVALLPVWRGARRPAAALVYRGRLTPAGALRLLDTRLADAHHPEDAAQILAETTARALGIDAAHVDGSDMRAGRRDALSPSDDLAEQDVVYGGETIARIHVSPRPAETALTAADRRILSALAARSGPALHAARTVTALLVARAAAATAHEEERTILRRDLHDDLAPTLVGLSLTANGLARGLRGRGEPLLSSAAEAMVSDVQSAIAQTRALVYGLREPGLENGGLVRMIRERARSTEQLRIRVEAPTELSRIPAPIELTALRIVQEAVTNVRRHAGATHCEVRLGVQGDALEIAVDDDGSGMPAEPVGGVGLASLRDRVAGLGGALRVQRSPLGGVRIAARLPLTAEASVASSREETA